MMMSSTMFVVSGWEAIFYMAQSLHRTRTTFLFTGCLFYGTTTKIHFDVAAGSNGCKWGPHVGLFRALQASSIYNTFQELFSILYAFFSARDFFYGRLFHVSRGCYWILTGARGARPRGKSHLRTHEICFPTLASRVRDNTILCADVAADVVAS